MARIGRDLGLDVSSIYELERDGWADEEHLQAAGADRRIFVTYNRDDFLELTRRFFHENRAHCGVIIISWSFRRDRPAEIAHRLGFWAETMEAKLSSAELPPYTVDYLR